MMIFVFEKENKIDPSITGTSGEKARIKSCYIINDTQFLKIVWKKS